MKALLDSLGHAGAFIDDSQIDRLHIERREPVAGGEAAVRVTALALTAALALLLSRRARRGGSPSLALADSLCAQALLMAAILSLAPLAGA